MGDKERINKQMTSDVQRDRKDEFEIAGNVREKSQNPAPDDRSRGERSDNEPAGPGRASRR